MPRFYFDYNASAPVLPEVSSSFADAVRDDFGNASSVHREGQQARRRLEESRRVISSALKANAADLVFTSGGTESNSLAILGVCRAARRNAGPDAPLHVVTSSIEHPSVLETCREALRTGIELTVVPVAASGVIAAADVAAALRPHTALVSIMHVNNETGAIQPVAEIAALVQERRAQRQSVWFHSDGVQAFGKLGVNLSALGADLYSLSGHKIGAPKGAGALCIRQGVPLAPNIHGGRQERSRRAGTENVPAAVALARAAELGAEHDSPRLAALRDELESRILSALPGARINAARAARVPNTSNIFFPGVAAESMVIALDLRGFAVSTGSACSSGSLEPSPVLLAMGLSPDHARSSVRFSLGPSNDREQVVALAGAVVSIARQISFSIPPQARKAADVVPV